MQTIPPKNQKLCLVEALFGIQALHHGLEMLNYLPKFMATSYPSISATLISYCHDSIDPIYKRFSSLPLL